MEKSINYLELYLLQDKILKLVSKLDNDFYLTGGTALHRFYYDARYSDDLDFFVTNGDNFNEDVNEIVYELKCQDYGIVEDVKSRDFYRITVDALLQLDFVNDRVYRHKKSNMINGLRIDNKINILTNKISTIINRDEEKDIFDLFCLAYHEEFNWGEMIEIANKKAVIEKDVLIYRLKSFPLEWLQRIKKIKDIGINKEDVFELCNDILHNNDNSLKMKA
ncbi:MAG: nucleotidyl transferase AbiEii/AbiGii toxin family protein [Campylobacterota bacterium]|nr:nucleotidyl transferase AbiEii/AbiGii toxin family protein [Campylobacterota bacterium]